MVRKVLWYLLIALVVIVVIIWLIGGGIGKIQEAAGSFSNPFTSSLFGGGAVQLPFAVPIPQGVDISNLTGGSGQTTSQAQTLGNPSSYGNQIALSADGATASDPEQEYVSIQNQSGNAIDLSGWSLQSALSGARAYIPRGASFFEVGALNQQTDIELQSGGTAIVTTGLSPVGTSFRENACSGYLEELQPYTPPVQTQCPLPNVNAAQYGQACADFVSSIPFCTLPRQFPSNISAACQSYVQNTFSYNGCVQSHQGDASFPLSTWRIYLGASSELWNNNHDTIRLLDSQGQVVAVTSY